MWALPCLIPLENKLSAATAAAQPCGGGGCFILQTGVMMQQSDMASCWGQPSSHEPSAFCKRETARGGGRTGDWCLQKWAEGENMPQIHPFVSRPEIRGPFVVSMNTDDTAFSLWISRRENRWLLLWDFVATLYRPICTLSVNISL